MEQRVVSSESAYPFTSSQLSQAVNKEMADGSWFAKQQLMKPVQVGQYTWSVTQKRNTNVADFSVPGIFEKVESLTLRTLRMYAFYRMSPIIRVQINSTQFHQGQLIAAFDPFSLTVNSPFNDVYGLVYATGLPHVKIMASESDAVELKLPFVHPRSFLTTNTDVFNNLGHFYLTVMNPLVVAEGTTPSVTVTIWMYAEDADVHVPIFDHDPILEVTSGENLNPILPPTSLPKTQADPLSGMSLASKLGKGFGEITSIIGNVMTYQFGQALRKGQGLIDTLGSLLGFDYPSDPIMPQKFLTPVENLGAGKGKSRSMRMAIDPYSLHDPGDDVAAESLNAMNLKSILSMPMLLSQFEFASTSEQDALLFNCPVHPQVSPFQIITEDIAGVQRTYLSYISNAFTYWNGGIKFDIEVVATRFHSGKLLVAYVPNSQAIPTYQQATLLPNVIIDIQQTSNTTFVVPYTSSTAMKSTLLKIEPTDHEFVDAATGTLVVYVQNLLTHASNVSPTIEINVYIYAAEDFGLYVLRRPAFNITTAPKSVESTSGISIISNANAPSSTTAVLSKDQDISVPRKHFGEEYNFHDILRRFSYYGSTSVESETSRGLLFNVSPFDLLFVNNEFYPNNTLSLLSYFSRIYSAWSGTIRYKLSFPAPRSSSLVLQIDHNPDPLRLDIIDTENLKAETFDKQYASNGYSILQTNLSQDNAIEFEVPYYSKYNMLLTRFRNTSVSERVGGDEEYTFNGSIYQFTQSGTATEDESVLGSIYTAAGEDFRFIYLRPPPLVSSIYLYFVTTLA